MTTLTRPGPTSKVVVPVVIGAVLGAAVALIWGLTVHGVRGLVTGSGDVLLRDGQLDNLFLATAAFSGLALVGGLLTAILIFRGPLRTPRGVAVTLGAAVVGTAVAVLLGQAVVEARFAGPGARGLDFTAAPSIRQRGANVLGPADSSGGALGDLASWVLVFIWPGAAALWCTAVATLGRLPDDD
ncbi:hypothetical protein GCM10027289_03050 [Tsukamurella serpentis]